MGNDRPMNCTVAGCAKPLHYDGLCQMHRWRLKYHGSVEYKPWPEKTCTHTGCTRKHKANGLCALHYRRQKNGLPLDFSSPTLAKKRYRLLKRLDHPLADALGRVYEHRLVLFESIGFTRVPCFWCGVGVVFGDNLYVDHLNHDRHDNKLVNLVPTCNTCNAGRTHKNPRIRKSVYA